MKHITIILLAGTAAMFMSACGGGGGGDSSFSGEGVAIIYHYPAEICESDLLLDELEAAMPPEASNISTSVASNEVTCATYGKTDGYDCGTEDMVLLAPGEGYEQYDTSCVISFDVNIAAKIIMDTQRSEDIALAAEFALDAQ